MADFGYSIIKAFDHVWGRFLDRLDGLTDGEYFWEPVPGSWSVRRDDDGRWIMDGTRGGWRAPEPAPVTTIAWRIGHIGQGLTFFAGRLSPAGPPRPMTSDSPLPRWPCPRSCGRATNRGGRESAPSMHRGGGSRSGPRPAPTPRTRPPT